MEKELIASLMDGSDREAAFRRVMRLYNERLFGVIIGMTRNREDAMDILQETWIKAYQAIDKFRSQSSLYTWLCRIAINTTLSALRKPDVRSELDEGLEDFSMSPQQLALRNESKEWIQKAIESLPEKQKMVFVLKYLDENTYKEISEIMNISEGAVKAQCFHAFNKVKQFMEEHYPDKEATHG